MMNADPLPALNWQANLASHATNTNVNVIGSQDEIPPGPGNVDPSQTPSGSGVPILNSNPGAPVTIYLDFDGNYESHWWQEHLGEIDHYYNVFTRAFDPWFGGSEFTAAELQMIHDIWARVAEDFSPFNVNVTTSYAGSFDDHKAMHVVIGGYSTDWLDRFDANGVNTEISGTSELNSFNDPAFPNTVYVFSDSILWMVSYHEEDLAPAIATTISHEVGHAFGLLHQGVYNADGDKVGEYNNGTRHWTPIMGNNLATDRTTWAKLPSILGIEDIQDDVRVIARPQTGITLRADDHSDAIANATVLTQGVTPIILAQGLINHGLDKDIFQFTTTTASPVRIQVDAAQYGPNLIPAVSLVSSSGLATGPTSGSFTRSTIEVYLEAGTHYIFVRGAAGQGTSEFVAGQYTLQVGFDPQGNTPNSLPLPAPGSASLLNPWASGKKSLLVTGTSDDDVIKLRLDQNKTLQVHINGIVVSQYAKGTVGNIVINGQAGNDTIQMPPNLRTRALIDGGDGDDTIVGGAGHDLLIGGKGNDHLSGKAGRDVLIGGLGRDLLLGGGDQDLLIGGFTSHDTDWLALEMVWQEWASKRGFGGRIARLEQGSSGLPVVDSSTVFADEEMDSLQGGGANDWLFASVDEVVKLGRKDRRTG